MRAFIVTTLTVALTAAALTSAASATTASSAAAATSDKRIDACVKAWAPAVAQGHKYDAGHPTTVAARRACQGLTPTADQWSAAYARIDSTLSSHRVSTCPAVTRSLNRLAKQSARKGVGLTGPLDSASIAPFVNRDLAREGRGRILVGDTEVLAGAQKDITPLTVNNLAEAALATLKSGEPADAPLADHQYAALSTASAGGAYAYLMISFSSDPKAPVRCS